MRDPDELWRCYSRALEIQWLAEHVNDEPARHELLRLAEEYRERADGASDLESADRASLQ